MFERKSIAFIVFVILRNAVKISCYLVVCLYVFGAHHMKQYKYIPHYSILDLQCLENEKKSLHNFVAAVSKCQHESKLEICRTLTDE